MAYAAAFLVAIFSWFQFLWPPVRAYQAARADSDGIALLGMLLRPITPIYPDVPLGGYMFIGLGIILAVVVFGLIKSVLTYWENARVPISVLETHLELSFQSDDLREATLSRKQLLHANRRNVTVYIHKAELTSPSHQTAYGAITCSSVIGYESITDNFETFGSTRAVEIVERFKRELPTNWVATLMPNSWVRSLHKIGIFNRLVVTRYVQTTQFDEYNNDRPRITVSSLRYPVTNVQVTLRFPASSAPDPADIKALLVRENAASNIAVQRTPAQNEAVYTVGLDEFYKCTLRVYWSNSRLQAMLAARAATPLPAGP
jgi:hypothetical protein